jgi:hypothetical protein
VVVPSPVHYDRAGRRVIEPGWQDTLTQIVRSEREAAANEAANAAAAGAAADGTAANAATDTGAAGNEAPGEAEGVQPTEPVRETIIVVPGPTTWRIPGILTVAKGMLALDGDDGVLWYLPGLERYIGFIDGLDAGEAVILEGYASAMGSSQERYFQPTRIFIDDMGYDLSIPPYGLLAQPYLTNPSGQTLIREAAPLTGTTRDPSPAAGRNDAVQNGQSETGQNGQGQAAQNSRDETRPPWSRRESPSPQAPVWQHNHTSPWAPPTSVFDFDPDYDDSFWQDDPAKLEQRERDSREIWY